MSYILHRFYLVKDSEIQEWLNHRFPLQADRSEKRQMATGLKKKEKGASWKKA